jgi:hypothetical protein
MRQKNTPAKKARVLNLDNCSGLFFHLFKINIGYFFVT